MNSLNYIIKKVLYQICNRKTLTIIDNILTSSNTIYFYLQSRKFEENCLQCPETTKLLEAIPRRTGVACFSAVFSHIQYRRHRANAS